MKRILAGTLLVLLLLGAGGALWLRFLTGTPVGPFPGGALSGTLAETLPDDWTFANEEDYVAVESRAGMFPYSRGVWFMAYQGRLHLLLPSFFGDGLKRRLDVDPVVRVRVGEILYDQVAVLVDDPSVRAEMVKPLLLRQVAIEIGGAVRASPGPSGGPAFELWVYRLDDPPAR